MNGATLLTVFISVAIAVSLSTAAKVIRSQSLTRIDKAFLIVITPLVLATVMCAVIVVVMILTGTERWP